MMFDTLVCAPSEDQAEFDEGFEIFRGSKALCDEVLRKTSYFDSYKSGQGGARDPILQYLQRYYSPSEQLDSSDVGDLSWDEGDLPHHHIKVWTFNDFMGQYNQLYAFLNNIQVQYHTDKRSPHSTSPRMDGLLRDLERDVERREHFLRECGRMVGAFPELEEEVGWRVEHVIAKWEMLAQLRGKGRGAEAATDIYSDIELEVRCLRRWLREMEARIDPLQFGGVEGWSAGDRERKMAEYQVLQTDIESHGRVVKLVLGLCEELGQDPGLYDLQHAVKVARGLERRWHHIWLRSLEWQCLLEQWIHRPARGEQAEDSVFDTDDEPLTKVPRLTSDLGSCTASPAATLLRRKRRKRWPGTPREEHGGALLSPEVQGGGEVPEEGVKMQTSESDPSTAPSTARSESSESTFGFQGGAVEGVERGKEQRGEEAKDTPLTPLSILQVLEDIIDVDENSHDGFWDTSDEDAFLENKNKLMQKVRKVTVVHQPPFALETRKSEEKENTSEDQNVIGKRWDRSEEVWKKSVWESDGEEWSELEGRRRSEEVEGRKRSEESMFSQDSLEVPEVPGRPRGLVWTEGSSGEEDTCSSETDKDQASAPEQLLSFGDDYRRFLESLSDSSEQRARPSRRLKKRSTKRREGGEGPYDSNSEGEVELEAACATLAASLAAVTKVEQQAAAFFTLPEAARDPADYDAILRSCSEQVNLLFHLLAAVGRRQGFPQQKRARDIRLLIGRWEGLLQTVSETVHNSTVYHGLRRQRDEVREALVRLESAALGEGEELDVRLAAIKVGKGRLEEQQAALLALSLALQAFLRELAASSHADQQHLHLAAAMEQEVVELHGLWDLVHHQVAVEEVRVEAGLLQLAEVRGELGELRAEVTRHTGELLRRVEGGSGSDSGWASEGPDLPGQRRRLGRLRALALGLGQVLSPSSPAVREVARSLEATQAELGELQRILRLRGRGERRKVGRAGSRGSARAGPVAGRRRAVSRWCLGMQALLLLLLLLAWLCQPTCCDSYSTISPFAPHLQYVNGPPPI